MGSAYRRRCRSWSGDRPWLPVGSMCASALSNKEKRSKEIAISKSRNTFAKKMRENDKRRKAEEKRASRRDKALRPPASNDKPPEDEAGESEADSETAS